MSSTKKECFRSAPPMASDWGVMCSATQAGFRVRLSKAEVVDRVGCMSLTGPGKPYWKRPDGSTGGMMALEGKGDIGTGGWGVVGVGAPTTIVTGGVEILRSRVEKSAAAAAAPVRADTPATTANVVFDMSRGDWGMEKSGKGGLVIIYVVQQPSPHFHELYTGQRSTAHVQHHDVQETRAVIQSCSPSLGCEPMTRILPGCVGTAPGTLAGMADCMCMLQILTYLLLLRRGSSLRPAFRSLIMMVLVLVRAQRIRIPQNTPVLLLQETLLCSSSSMPALLPHWLISCERC